MYSLEGLFIVFVAVAALGAVLAATVAALLDD